MRIRDGGFSGFPGKEQLYREETRTGKIRRLGGIRSAAAVLLVLIVVSASLFYFFRKPSVHYSRAGRIALNLPRIRQNPLKVTKPSDAVQADNPSTRVLEAQPGGGRKSPLVRKTIFRKSRANALRSLRGRIRSGGPEPDRASGLAVPRPVTLEPLPAFHPSWLESLSPIPPLRVSLPEYPGPTRDLVAQFDSRKEPLQAAVLGGITHLFSRIRRAGKRLESWSPQSLEFGQ